MKHRPISRRPAQGVMSVVRFNWPMYAAAGAVGAACAGALGWRREPAARALAKAGLFAAGWFLGGSLGASFLVYDLSDLYRWRWLRRALAGLRVRRAIIAHAGFDEVSEPLAKALPDTEWTLLDHFGPEVTTERSIQRARAMFPPPPGTIAARLDDWPLAEASADAIFALLAIHELRKRGQRAAWFREAARCGTRHARLILVEHVRDAASFAAFGPGFLHFHSAAEWRRSWMEGGWTERDAFRITPFVRVFILERTP